MITHFNKQEKHLRTLTSCLYLIRHSRLIKSSLPDENNRSYIDNYFTCTKLQKRISKRHCANCVMYKRVNNGQS